MKALPDSEGVSEWLSERMNEWLMKVSECVDIYCSECVIAVMGGSEML